MDTYCNLERFIQSLTIGGVAVKNFYKLGEKFFPSIGVTPEQVYPYVVILAEPSSELHWVTLKDLYDNLEQLKDGHLLISVMRLVHAIKYY